VRFRGYASCSIATPTYARISPPQGHSLASAKLKYIITIENSRPRLYGVGPCQHRPARSLPHRSLLLIYVVVQVQLRWRALRQRLTSSPGFPAVQPRHRHVWRRLVSSIFEDA